MNATYSLEHDNSSFSKILLSKVADIINQVVIETNPVIHPKCNDRENNKGDFDV